MRTTYLHVRVLAEDEKVSRTVEVEEGHLFLDLNSDGEIVGVEVIGEWDYSSLMWGLLRNLRLADDALARTATDQNAKDPAGAGPNAESHLGIPESTV